MTASGRWQAVGATLWAAACVMGGCTTERVTAVESVDSGTDDAGGTRGGDATVDGTRNEETSASAGGSGDDDGAGSSSGGDAADSTSVCTDAGIAFTTSDPNGQWLNAGDGYFIRNDAWNSDAGPQTLSACSYSSWNVVASEPSTTDVKSYPDVQMDFQAPGASNGSGVPISLFNSITSTFAETSPHIGIYDDAYDIFVNSNMIVGQGTTEIMIWVDNYNQVPSGTKVSTAPLDNRNYDVYYEADNGDGGHYIAFVANESFSDGTVDILAFFKYAIDQSWIPATAPLNQICFGVEISETGGGEATFEFTDFSITATHN
jgi:glycosyl hydrolase family 12